jgi:hypothetical protein
MKGFNFKELWCTWHKLLEALQWLIIYNIVKLNVITLIDGAGERSVKKLLFQVTSIPPL